MSFMMMFAVDDSGAGDAGSGDDLGDFVIDEPETPPADTPPTDDKPSGDDPKDGEADAKDEKPAEKDDNTSKDDKIAALEAELEALKGNQEEINKFVSQKQMEEMVTAETEKLQSRYPDFDIEVVGDYLKELAKTDEAQAQALNNPIGWENIFLKMEIENGRGEFLPTRAVSKEPFNYDKTAEKARAGDRSAQIALFDNIK